MAATGPSRRPKQQRPRLLFISIFETLSVAIVVPREGGEGEGTGFAFTYTFANQLRIEKVAGGNCHNHFQSKYKIHLVAVIEFKVCFLLYHTEF